MSNTLNITIVIIRLLIKSAVVKTWLDIAESTKYLFPTAPKIAPTLKFDLASNSDIGIKKTNQDKRSDKKEPKNNLKNSQEPCLLNTTSKTPLDLTSFLSVPPW